MKKFTIKNFHCKWKLSLQNDFANLKRQNRNLKENINSKFKKKIIFLLSILESDEEKSTQIETNKRHSHYNWKKEGKASQPIPARGFWEIDETLFNVGIVYLFIYLSIYRFFSLNKLFIYNP